MRILLWSIFLAASVALAACATSAAPTAAPARPVGTATARPTPTAGTPGSTPTPRVVQGPQGNTYKQWARPPLLTINPASKYTAKLLTNKGSIAIELFAAEAPTTVNNFVFLAREGYYNGVIFHRILKDFMVQSGDPRGDGTGGPGYRFVDEPITRKYDPGMVAMANAGPNTNGSQFFIMHGTSVRLSPNYTIFGKVVEGMDTVDRIAKTPVVAGSVGEVSHPTERIVINSVEITEKPGP